MSGRHFLLSGLHALKFENQSNKNKGESPLSPLNSHFGSFWEVYPTLQSVKVPIRYGFAWQGTEVLIENLYKNIFLSTRDDVVLVAEES
jgi:hypothetical protein